MITEEILAQEFTAIIKRTQPRLWQLLRHCYVKVINSYTTQSRLPHPPYIGIYCPEHLISAVASEKNVLRQVAKFVGLVEVVCVNATHLLRDPKSTLKQTHPHLWLDLIWICTEKK